MVTLRKKIQKRLMILGTIAGFPGVNRNPWTQGITLSENLRDRIKIFSEAANNLAGSVWRIWRMRALSFAGCSGMAQGIIHMC
jgi:hypothetical protein